jgi:hypothetical protein
MRKFLIIKNCFQKICKKFQPLTPRTKKFPAAAADNKKFPAAAADREKKIEIFQPPPPIAQEFFSSRRRETKKIENFQPLPPRKTSAYTSIGDMNRNEIILRMMSFYSFFFTSSSRK